MTDETQTFYRYEERTYSRGCDEVDNPYPGYNLALELSEYQVVKRTPKGVWLSRAWGGSQYLNIQPSLSSDRRFMRLGTRKQFAHLTKEEALRSFRARKKRQLKILKAQMKCAERALEMADRIEESGGQSVPRVTVWE